MLNKRILTLVFLVTFLTLLTGCLTPPNQAPILTSDPITTATIGVEYIYNVDATDPDGDTLTYSLATKPSGMTINSANGLIKWTPTTKGNYAVIVKISDGDLDITQSFTIVVTEPPNQAPIASFTASPVSGEAPLEVSFNASNSSDSDGSIISYEWDFKDGDTGSGEIVNHTFSSTGNYNVELTVTDNGGATDSTTKTITVTETPNQAPTASFTAIPISGVTPLTVSFNASGSSDSDGTIISYIWNFGDSSTGSGITTSHIYENAGEYTIQLTVSDNDSATDSTTKTITVTEPPNQPPTASFTAIPTSGVTPLEVFFDASDSYDPDGNIVSYEWDFEDGDTGSGETINHTFSSIGSYNVELTVTDNKGAMDSATKPITVTEPIDNEIVYRALCVGVGDYKNYGPDTGDLLGPPYDVDRIIQVLSDWKFGSDEVGFSLIESLKDLNATKEAIINGIASTFSGADDNDISYFYFSGHGSYTGVFATSYICPTDILSDSYDNDISVNELESALSAIPGTKVVILDTCFSGGFIGKGKEKITISKEGLTSFNDEIINVFFQAEYKGLLTTNQYKVLTSCHYYQACIELYPTVPGTFDPFGVFTMGLCEGCGYYGNYPADTNLDTEVSLQEAYLYVKFYVAELDTQLPHIIITQDVQVYPNNSNYTIVEY